MTEPSSRHTRLHELFTAAMHLPQAQQEPYLLRACPDDPALIREVLALLRAADSAPDDFLTPPPPPPDPPSFMSKATPHPPAPYDPAKDTLPGRRLKGRYTIQHRIGEGGMSVVYEARQDHPQRRVALKIMRLGLLSPRVLRRFEHEPDILARFDHPGIVRVLESDVEDFGAGPQPFLVMEFVEGVPLTQFAREQRLSLRDRLTLFAEVCDAVQEAHQKGVIHRDLKPSNILVTAQGQPKILDFGIAKVMDVSAGAPGLTGGAPGLIGGAPGLTGAAPHTLLTEGVQLMGTLQYMSPEQCDVGSSSLRDDRGRSSLRDESPSQSDERPKLSSQSDERPKSSSRSDELPALNPQPQPPNPEPQRLNPEPQPLNSSLDTRSDIYALGVLLYELLTDRMPYDVSNMTIISAARTVCEAAPTPPSHFDRRLRGDLDAIILKALEKDRTHRYPSATHLADDIQRHLAGEPTTARPATWRTRAGRWMRRHPFLTTAACCALIGGLSGFSTYFMARLAAGTPFDLLYSPMRNTLALLSLGNETLWTWEGVSRCANAGVNQESHPLSLCEIEGRDIVLMGFGQSSAEAFETPSGATPVAEAPRETPQASDTRASVDIHYARSVCAFDAHGPYDEPLWYARIEDEDDFGKDPMARDFKATEWYPVALFGPYDIFSEAQSPGPEVVVVFNNGPYSQKCYRVYSAHLPDARETSPRHPLYQVLADGGGWGLVAWDAKNGWLVTAGQNSSVYWLHREGGPPQRGYPSVVFAFRPEFEMISTDYLWLESEAPPADIQPPPPRVEWLYALRNQANRYHPAAIMALTPRHPGEPYEVKYGLVHAFGSDLVGVPLSITLPINGLGNLVLNATRLPSDSYSTQLQERQMNPDQGDPYCIDPDAWRLGRLPPVRAESRTPEEANGSQYSWYRRLRSTPKPLVTPSP